MEDRSSQRMRTLVTRMALFGYSRSIFRARVAFPERCSPPVHARRVFSCDSGTFALFVGYDGKAAEPGNRQSRRMAARSHARAAFLCLSITVALI
jgi:hypothetical protein